MVDDSRVILSDSLAVLEAVMPDATITGFIWPQEAIEYAKMNQIALAILDIEPRILPRRMEHRSQRVHGQAVDPGGCPRAA